MLTCDASSPAHGSIYIFWHSEAHLKKNGVQLSMLYAHCRHGLGRTLGHGIIDLRPRISKKEISFGAEMAGIEMASGEMAGAVNDWRRNSWRGAEASLFVVGNQFGSGCTR
uniref:Uncharacterized protein n=1 Tax=Romanomermis culicivorax TaxID=13658 RepID=A0A915K2F8_ROMCU